MKLLTIREFLVEQILTKNDSFTIEVGLPLLFFLFPPLIILSGIPTNGNYSRGNQRIS